MVAVLLTLFEVALAAPRIECDPVRARQVMTEARIREDRVSSSHPYLIPGLALASPQVDPELATVLQDLCDSELELSFELAETWDTALFSAQTILFTATREEDCSLRQSTVAVTVGNTPGQPPHYALRSVLPKSTTPVGDCDATPTWREETVLAGRERSDRVVLVIDRQGDDIVASSVVVRSASATGWREQVLAAPAPRRYTGGYGGMAFALVPIEDTHWVIASHDRTDDPESCSALPGQTLWQREAERWHPIEGRAALSLLAERGLWRHAGEDGWLLILTQDDPAQVDDILARMRRMQLKNEAPLQMVDSSHFPGLTAGYFIVTPRPFLSRRAAESMRTAWGRRASAYVKRAWTAPDPCLPAAEASRE